VPIVKNSGSLNLLETYEPVIGLYRDCFIFNSIIEQSRLICVFISNGIFFSITRYISLTHCFTSAHLCDAGCTGRLELQCHVAFVHLCDTLRTISAAGSKVYGNVTSLRHAEGSLIVP
jgi:hypothetical protein